MDLGIKGRAALIGGASSGIGLACARALAGEGVRVALVARREKETWAAAEAIRADFGVEAVPLVADLTQDGACERVVAEAREAFGALDILVPNAGGPKAARFAALSDADWEVAFKLTYMTTVRLIRAALPHMEKRGWGRVVTIGSLVTHEPRGELTASSGLRTGLVALTKVLARDYARHGITLNIVGPGYTRTARQIELAAARGATTGQSADEIFAATAAEIPAGRMAEPEEIGAVVAFLCSERAAFVNGVDLLVDGAHTRGI
jgi:3-oxoacyl-[acyl-carrier protein] reductase